MEFYILDEKVYATTISYTENDGEFLWEFVKYNKDFTKETVIKEGIIRNPLHSLTQYLLGFFSQNFLFEFSGLSCCSVFRVLFAVFYILSTTACIFYHLVFTLSRTFFIFFILF